MGVLSSQEIEALVKGESPSITAVYKDMPILPGQIQPASFDFRLARKAYCLRAAGLPRPNESVEVLIQKYGRYDFDFTKEEGNVFEKGLCYIVPLAESVSLFADHGARFSTKSSIGRTDVFCRVLVDGLSSYDTLPKGYSGKVYVEIASLSWSLRIRPGIGVTQGRIKRAGNSILTNREVEELHARHGIVRGKDGRPIANGNLALEEDGYVTFHLDLDRDIVGWKAKPAISTELCLFKEEAHDIEEFYEPIRRPRNGEFIAEPGAFYLLATKERLVIPDNVCAQFDEYTVTAGELRNNYAGFFDSHFGVEEGGKHGVLEVRVRDLPARLIDGCPMGRMYFQRMSQIPNQLYGKGSHYTGPHPQLPKFFKDFKTAWV